MTDTYPSFNSSTIIHFLNQTKYCNRKPDFEHAKMFSQGVVLLNGSLYICGGLISNGNYSKDCHIYLDNKWAESHAMTEKRYKSLLFY
jgi:hypothetical protein